MKTTKLVIGIITLVLSVVMLFQSCVVSIGDAFIDEGSAGGSMGIFVAILMIIAGIVAIAARKSRGGAITSMIFYALAGIIAIAGRDNFADLMVWGVIALIFASVFLVDTITFKKRQSTYNA